MYCRGSTRPKVFFFTFVARADDVRNQILSAVIYCFKQNANFWSGSHGIALDESGSEGVSPDENGSHGVAPEVSTSHGVDPDDFG